MLRFSGIGSSHCPELGCCCAHFFSKGNLILLDCGEDTFSRLSSADVFDKVEKDIYCFVTHMHSDHVGSLPTLCLYIESHYGKKVHVCFPNTSIVALLSLMGVPASAINFEFQSPITISDSIKITTVKTDHVIWMESYGYIIETSDEKAYYSGDSNSVPNEILSMFNDGELDKIYQDVSLLPGDEGPHLKLDHLCKLIGIDMRSRVYTMHYDSKQYLNIVTEAGFSVVKQMP